MALLLLLKLTLTPLLIGGASLAARRWGPAVGGWLVALPLTSAPVAFYLALERGTAFAAGTAEGSLAGLAAVAAFGLTYARIVAIAPSRRSWAAAWGTAALVFAIVATISARVTAAPVWALAAAIELWLGATYVALPSMAAGTTRPAPRPRWELPARMLVGTSLVLAITGVAGALGPGSTGVLSTFPVYVSVLAVFAHRVEGPSPAIAVVRGTAAGLFGTAAFLAVLSASLVAAGVALAFAAALVACGVAQTGVLVLLRRGRGDVMRAEMAAND